MNEKIKDVSEATKSNRERITEEAIQRKDKYNSEPNKCLCCSSPILAKCHKKLYDIKLKKFCSRSCSARYNNKIFPKRSIFLGDGTYKLKGKCACGDKKDYKANYCQKCLVIKNHEVSLKRPIRDMICLGNARIKYGQIRTWANRILEREGIEKTCSICRNKEFDPVVEAAHIQSISTFSEDALMGEVNSLDNLIYLCPSHHKLFDKGFIEKEKIVSLNRRYLYGGRVF
jgi:hypothetical protein